MRRRLRLVVVGRLRAIAAGIERALETPTAPSSAAPDAELLDKLQRLATPAAPPSPVAAAVPLRCELCRMHVDAFAAEPLQLRQRAYRLIGAAPFVAGPTGEVCAFHALFTVAAPPRQELD